jgi:serine acetyltransferase
VPGAKLFGAIAIWDGAVIGANAAVNRDVLPHVVVGGVPARVLTDVVPSPSVVIDAAQARWGRLGYTIDAYRKPPAKV